jgi:hypothetical protein
MRPLFTIISIAVATALYPTLFRRLETARDLEVAADPSAPLLYRVVDSARIGHYLPDVIEDARRLHPTISFALDYLVIALMGGLLAGAVVCGIVHVIRRTRPKDETSIVDDPEFEVRHGAIPSPAQDYATDVCGAIPADVTAALRKSILLGECASPLIPEVRPNRLEDNPGHTLQRKPKNIDSAD